MIYVIGHIQRDVQIIRSTISKAQVCGGKIQPTNAPLDNDGCSIWSSDGVNAQVLHIAQAGVQIDAVCQSKGFRVNFLHIVWSSGIAVTSRVEGCCSSHADCNVASKSGRHDQCVLAGGDCGEGSFNTVIHCDGVGREAADCTAESEGVSDILVNFTVDDVTSAVSIIGDGERGRCRVDRLERQLRGVAHVACAVRAAGVDFDGLCALKRTRFGGVSVKAASGDFFKLGGQVAQLRDTHGDLHAVACGDFEAAGKRDAVRVGHFRDRNAWRCRIDRVVIARCGCAGVARRVGVARAQAHHVGGVFDVGRGCEGRGIGDRAVLVGRRR